MRIQLLLAETVPIGHFRFHSITLRSAIFLSTGVFATMKCSLVHHRGACHQVNAGASFLPWLRPVN